MFEVVGRGAGKAHTLRSLKNEAGGGWKGVVFGLGLTGEREGELDQGPGEVEPARVVWLRPSKAWRC